MNKTINAHGRKYQYSHSVAEDANGNWNSEDYTILNGYIVVHAGFEHRIYREA